MRENSLRPIFKKMARAEPCGESRGKGCQGRENTLRKEGEGGGAGSEDTVRAVRGGVVLALGLY